MNRKFRLTLMKVWFLLFVACSFVACDKQEDDLTDATPQTLFVYMPWSGSNRDSGLYSYFLTNLDSIKAGIVDAKGLSNRRVMVFLSTSSTNSKLYELTFNGKDCEEHVLKNYEGNSYTTADGLAGLLTDVKTLAPALNYAMIIGCHGCGWTYKEDWTKYPYESKYFPDGEMENTVEAKSYGESIPYERTRFFGSVSDYQNYATDITTLEQGIAKANMKMQYILFDDCYMANVETAYELKDVTNFLVGCTSEIMAIGMPYRSMWSSLSSATPSYDGMTAAFLKFYQNYRSPYGAIGAIDCRQTTALGQVMREINYRYTFDEALRDSVQILGGFNPTVFYDLGSYVKHLCKDSTLLQQFNTQLAKTVRSSATTEEIYSYIFSTPITIAVKEFSGITVSDLSLHPVAMKGKEKTGWWKLTHEP